MNRLELRRQAARRLPALAVGSDPWPDEYRREPDRPGKRWRSGRSDRYPSTFGLSRAEIVAETRRLIASGWSRQDVEMTLAVRVRPARMPLEPIGTAALTWQETA